MVKNPPVLFALALTLTAGVFSSCSEKEKTTASSPEPTLKSEELSKQFPLLPLIERNLWHKLLEAETAATKADATESEKREAEKSITDITETLLLRHPFHTDEAHITLGEISYQKATRQIHIPATVRFPSGTDTRHPNELELVLCSENGRTHETLFVTKARPLHLEILLHLAGFKKTPPASTFRLDVVIPDHPPIPSEVLFKSVNSEDLSGQFLWVFSGSDFNDLYSPDQTGDFLILWQAHDSVLSFSHEGVASGTLKVVPNKHRHLINGKDVTLVLTPAKTR